MKYLQYYRKPKKQNTLIKYLENTIDFLDKYLIGFLIAWFMFFLIRIMIF